MLLVASYLFYGWWDWRFLSLLFFSSLVDFTCGRLLDGKVPQHRRKDILAISLLSNGGMLLTFKYFDFFSNSLSSALASIGVQSDLPMIRLVLPVGISFYTFQTLSYTIDIYRGKLRSTDRLFDFMLYVSFFPQLVAGPIERATTLLPQILTPRRFEWTTVTQGAQLVLVGFFKKMVIADNLAPVVNDVYRDGSPNGLAIVLATYAFAFQIYLDFSGYTDIARGVARMLGFNLCLNFNLPYVATNPSDFWRRWHISLSTWIRDYVYIPLGGSRSAGVRPIINLIATMFLAGLWHGAAWHFVLWGIFHGILLVVFHQFGVKDKDVPSEGRQEGSLLFALKAIGFFQLTCVGWMIFRADSVVSFLQYFSNVMQVWNWSLASVDPVLPYRLLIFAVPFTLFQIYQFQKANLEPWQQWPVSMRTVFYLALFYAIVFLGTPEHQEFIYFQF